MIAMGPAKLWCAGSLPAEWASEGAFPLLAAIRLRDNALSGPLPPSYGRAGGLPSLSIM